jgi:hypothetical protein
MVEIAMFPAYAPIDKWVEISGVSRSRTYELMASKDIIAKKLHARVLIDVHAGLQFLNSLPTAQINCGKDKG